MNRAPCKTNTITCVRGLLALVTLLVPSASVAAAITIGGFLGVYYHSQIDAVEFGVTRQTLLNQGWDGSSVMYFTVMTVKDGSSGGLG